MYYKGHGKVKVDIMLLLLLTTAEPGCLHYDTDYFISLVFLTQMREKTFAGNRLSQVSMYVAFFYPCPYWGQSIFVSVGSFIVLNQLIAGSIMVRHMKLILVLSLPLRVY